MYGKMTAAAIACLLMAPVLPGIAAAAEQEKLLYSEDFEDDQFAGRGWYDSPRIEITDRDAKSGKHCCIWSWQKGQVLPGGKGGRVEIEPGESVILSYWVKHSPNWQWTGRGYHPHEFLFMTDLDPKTWGPASTHLTLYVEAVDGRAMMGLQDSRNIDVSRIGQDLTAITENRAVAGGNGDSDGYKGDHYKAGEDYRNGKTFKSEIIAFSDEPGPYYKGDWHLVKARFKLNSITGGKGVNDGEIQYWQDGKLLIDRHDVLFRTGVHPQMKIDQFLMLPYIGPGAKDDQWIMIDDLRITREP